MNPIPSPFRSTRTNDDERREKRLALLRAAARMFNERGFHATSLDDVAASLGVTKPVIYYHLGNKEQVLFECMRTGLEDLLKAANMKQGDGKGLDHLQTFLIKYAEIIMDDFGRCVIRTDDVAISAETRKKIRALKRKVDAALQAMIHQAVADGSVYVEDVSMTAFALAGAINWAAIWHRPQRTENVGKTAQALVAALCAGLRPK